MDSRYCLSLKKDFAFTKNIVREFAFSSTNTSFFEDRVMKVDGCPRTIAKSEILIGRKLGVCFE